MCLRVIGNYGMNFTGPDSHQLAHKPQMKNGHPRLLPTSQKNKTIFDFFPIKLWKFAFAFDDGVMEFP